MKKTIFILGLVLFLSACTPETGIDSQEDEMSLVEVKDEENDSEMEALDSFIEIVEPDDAPDDYTITDERLSDEELIEQGLEEGSYYYRHYLSYGETQLVELPFNVSGWNEYLIYNVFEGEEKDIIIPVLGAGCGGCVQFMSQYYVVSHSDLSVEMVNFQVFPSAGRVSPMNAIYSDYLNEMAVVTTNGNFGEQDYYEEVWVYLFDKNEWTLAKRIEGGQTVMCLSMGYSTDPKKVRFWEEALVTSPAEIIGDMSCEY